MFPFSLWSFLIFKFSIWILFYVNNYPQNKIKNCFDLWEGYSLSDSSGYSRDFKWLIPDQTLLHCMNVDFKKVDFWAWSLYLWKSRDARIKCRIKMTPWFGVRMTNLKSQPSLIFFKWIFIKIILVSWNVTKYQCILNTINLKYKTRMLTKFPTTMKIEKMLELKQIARNKNMQLKMITLNHVLIFRFE